MQLQCYLSIVSASSLTYFVLGLDPPKLDLPFSSKSPCVSVSDACLPVTSTKKRNKRPYKECFREYEAKVSALFAF